MIRVYTIKTVWKLVDPRPNEIFFTAAGEPDVDGSGELVKWSAEEILSRSSVVLRASNSRVHIPHCKSSRNWRTMANETMSVCLLRRATSSKSLMALNTFKEFFDGSAELDRLFIYAK